MVVARETSLQELLEGTKQYQVPLYQRTYSWTRSQFERLWEDVVKLAEDRVEDRSATHFIGSLVLAPSPSNGPTGVQEFLVVDGQQRLTTLSILLCAIRDYRAEHEGAEHFERISEQYLLNKWKQGEQRLKLLPTQADRASYQACLDATPRRGHRRGGSGLPVLQGRSGAADDPEDDQDIDRIEDAVISGLALGQRDRADRRQRSPDLRVPEQHRAALTQGDLLRNYLFMRLPTQADAVYQGLWLPLQTACRPRNWSCCSGSIWCSATRGPNRPRPTPRQQARLDRLPTEDEIKAEIERFARLGELLRTDPEARHGGRPERPAATGAAQATGAPPPSIRSCCTSWTDATRGPPPRRQIAEAMLYIESFLVRRLLIGRATANINRNLLESVTEVADEDDVAEALHRYLSSGRKYYASDEEVRAAVTTGPVLPQRTPEPAQAGAPVARGVLRQQGAGRPAADHRARDAADADRGVAGGAAPDLDEDETSRRCTEALEHTLGNLTLTGYNSTLSNSRSPPRRRSSRRAVSR